MRGKLALRTTLLFLLGALALTPSALAVEFTADRIDDPPGVGPCTSAPGDCSLRQAVSQANSGAGNSVVVPAGTYTVVLGPAGDDANSSGDLDVLDSTSIVGAGAAITRIQAAGRYDRVFDFVFGNLNVGSITGVTIAGGGTVSNGAGVQQLNGTLSITNSVITDNVIASASSGGGGIYFEKGTLNLDNTTVSGNSVSSGEGGGIYTSAPTSLNIANSTISGNSTHAPSDGGGGIYNQDQLSLVNSTVSGNSTSDTGGGIDNGDATIRNATISGNAAGTSGGGIDAGSGSNYQIENSIIAGNSAPANSANCHTFGGAVINSLGHNLEDSSTCPFLAAGDLSAANPLLGLLVDNGGPTQTMALLAGSPAIHAANAATCPATDQRGTPRTGGCDIGAFQYVDVTGPVVTRLKPRPTSFAARNSGGSIVRRRAARGTKVTFNLSESASVKFTVEKRIKGHRRGSKCTTKRKRGRRCTIAKRLGGSFTLSGVTGANSFKFTGRLRNRKLRPGNYQLVATPTDYVGNAGAAKRAKFKIVR